MVTLGKRARLYISMLMIGGGIWVIHGRLLAVITPPTAWPLIVIWVTIGITLLGFGIIGVLNLIKNQPSYFSYSRKLEWHVFGRTITIGMILSIIMGLALAVSWFIV